MSEKTIPFVVGILIGFIITLMTLREFAIYTITHKPNITLSKY